MSKVVENLRVIFGEAKKGVKELKALIIPVGIVLIALDIFTKIGFGVLDKVLKACEKVILLLGNLTGKGSNVTIIIIVIAFLIITLKKRD